jgi:uncharacterized protein
MDSNPVGWFEIYVADLARARNFYESVFKVKLERLPNTDQSIEIEMLAFPMKQGGMGAAGALAKMKDGPAGGGTSTIVYFSCDDCAVEASRVAAAGGEVMKDKFAIGEYGFIALVVDTEKNVIGLHSLH